MIERAERPRAAVFRQAGVRRAHAHRFRHTLSTDMLTKGGTEQDVADILGVGPNIVRKHYAKWTAHRQDRIFALMRLVHAPAAVQETGRECFNEGAKRGFLAPEFAARLLHGKNLAVSV